MCRLLPVLIVSFAVGTASPAQASERLPRQLANLTPGDFARLVRIADDALEPGVVLSTQKGYTRARSIKGARADDVHLRAIVDRSTGRVTWRVWHDLVDVSAHKQVVAVRFHDGAAPRTLQPIAVEHRLDRCPPTDGIGMCNKLTRVVFELPDQAMRAIAASYRPGSRDPWRFRFADSSGNEIVGGLAPAEAAGLIAAVEAWRQGSREFAGVD